jgi:hypothetical protein
MTRPVAALRSVPLACGYHCCHRPVLALRSTRPCFRS